MHTAFSLYVHIPYCLAKCPYCDFNSHAAEQWPEERYTDALCREIDHFSQLPPWRNAELATIFFGGGTPSLFAPTAIRRVLDAAFDSWACAESAEITLEANPGTIDESKLAGFRAAGVNRMSFGVQSFAAHHLRTLGRIHDAEAAVAAVHGARRAGFDNLSIDLIFALPHQTVDEWREDLRRAGELEPDHISAYNLTYEEGTPFRSWRDAGRLQAQPEEQELAMFDETRLLLAAAGYDAYEVSNFTRRGRECRHNVNYWRSGPYLGIGAGAHSFSGIGVEGAPWGTRSSNRKSPGLFMAAVEQNGHAVEHSERLDETQARGEFVFLGLRLSDGFAAQEFERRFGCVFESAFPHVSQLHGDGLLQLDGGHWMLTDRGLRLGDSVFATFV